ncbi:MULTISPECIES: translation initiation factor IF-2 [unclassified Coleofasciculus]|uniref:translation initiation factor IF-2 n=1 Tax=unclassified Coleofasciculus TaxID=2692782 RepID=UPI001882E82C|nr:MULTISPECIES: translation initiation factor IF-2 [unclassified Coleofasciculus]MBE9124797.1 translation initiation factor IF-2 [Coleofasciculus sp. LEGE 07081]MBE9147702.1 translation initiation factor IF-2 [Coleofasciculus sp. LEGE 07092]
MNNGKVRIYELSRELNLDNKDILNICEGLHIAVKSHSSTITESEAERIRAAAEKYAESTTALKSRDRTVSSEGSSKFPSNKSGRPNPQQRKNQILSLKPKSPNSSSSQQGVPQLASPPTPPVKPSANSPHPSLQLNRPQRVSEPEQESTPELVDKPEFQDFQEEATSDQTVEEKPQLIQPPVRPSSPKAQALQVERPILKRDRSETAPSEAEGSPTAARATTPTQTPTPSKPSSPARPSAPTPSIPKLQEPPKRSRPNRQSDHDIAAVGSEAEESDDNVLETPDLMETKVRRPTPPRQIKKKEWEDEEEDQEKLKSGKAGAKLKRRPQILEEEEDEDFESEQNQLNAPVSVSLSIARPPKPKSRPGQAGAMPVAATASQRKRPTAKGSGGKQESRNRQREKKAVPERPEKIVLTDSLTVREFASKLNLAETEIIKKLFFKGMAVNITQSLDLPTARMIAEELDVEVETPIKESPATKTGTMGTEDMENLIRRPPVVTIMGHVDHGKTTLLDAIRETKVAQGEAGGITQHIGAYHVDVEHEEQTQQVVFLDTPGHEAFTAMRARGARVTDIAILVVAADDGVQPQTIEAISHARAAKVPIVIAVNKIDKAEAQPDRVKQELMEHGLVPEEWGGDTIVVPVSAIQKENLDTLLEMILLVAEIEDLKANPNRPARGTVIEANLDKTRGPVATLLVQNGTLRVGDTLVAGSVLGKVRAMIDDRAARVEAASPSFAVEILGLNDVPEAGDEFEVFENEKEARSVASDRSDEQRLSRLEQVMASRRVTLNSLSAKAKEGELKELNLILKADVQGSVEAILGSLQQLPQNEVQIRVLLTAAGEITETDVDLAAASGAVIIGFNTALAHGARQAAEQEGVDVREYSIIYNLLDDIQGAMEGLLEPEQVEEPLGQVEVRAVFPVGRGAVAGCYVQSGKAIRNCHIRVRRGGKVIYEGVLDSLKRMKDDAKEVNAGYECGIRIDRFNDWTEGDIIETFKMVTKRRTLSAS